MLHEVQAAACVFYPGAAREAAGARKRVLRFRKAPLRQQRRAELQPGVPVFMLRALRRLRKKREIARIRQPGRYRLARVVLAHRSALKKRAPRRLFRARLAEVQLR